MSGVLDVRFPDPTQEGAFHAWERKRATQSSLARHAARTLDNLIEDWEVLEQRWISPSAINYSIAELLVVSKILQAMGGPGSSDDIGLIHETIASLDAVMLGCDDYIIQLGAIMTAGGQMEDVLKRLHRAARRAAV